MKKLLFSLAAMIAMVATSCVQADVEDINLSGNEGIVTFVVKTDALGSRTINDGAKARALSYAIYDSDWNWIKTGETVTMSDLQATLELRLVKNKTYNFAFWAQSSDESVNGLYTVDFVAKTLEVNYDYLNTEGAKALTANNDLYDAFYGTTTITVDHGTVNESVELTRPFAQINFAAAKQDVENAIAAGYTVATAKTEFVVTAYTEMNLTNGVVNTTDSAKTVTATFSATTNPTEELELKDGTKYDWLAMNYILVPGDENPTSLTKCQMKITNGSEAAITIDYPMAPAKRNWRTNLVGNLLTEAAVIKVEIVPTFENESTNVGYYVSNGVYHVVSAKGLKDISKLVKNGDSFKNKTIMLENDINLQDSRANGEWIPIGVGGNHFQGTFNGNGHKITGLTITERPEGTSQAALFGTVSGTVNISNLTIDGANINGLAYTDQDFYGSALIGTMYGHVTIKNVKVLNSYISGNNKVGALIAHDGVCSSLKIEGCEVDGCTFESTNVADGGSVGGLIGFFQGQANGEYKIKNSVVKNCTFNVVNSTNTGKRANSQFIGGIDSKANQVVYIDGCSVENNNWTEKFYVNGGEVTEGKYESLYVAEGIVWIGGERDDNANGKVFVNGNEIVLLKSIVIVEDGAEKTLKGIGIMSETTNAEGSTVYTYGVTTAEGLKNVNKLLAGVNARSNDAYSVDGATFKLLQDVDLLELNESGEPIPFKPIGNYRTEVAFRGVFDGQGHTIKNLNQNTWELDWGYNYGSGLGLGLFSCIENATIKNLNIDKASISGESALCGIVAATAFGECTFENITVTNSQCADYQYYAGGIVGWASGNHKYINCNVDATTTVATQWGDFDNSTGGVIGGAGGSATILMKDCTVACRIDSHSDVVSSYQWYAYRRCGMLIGNTSKTKKVGDTTYADAPQLTCENVKVIYGDWANYTYCKFAGTSWPWVRVQAGVSCSAYSNVRYGHPTDANGNTVVDDNHVHHEGEPCHELIVFDQLYGGGQGVYGEPAHEGVTVIYNNR